MDYSNMVKELGDKILVSQTEFSKMHDDSYVSINRWENSNHEPTIKTKRRTIKPCKKNGIDLKQHNNYYSRFSSWNSTSLLFCMNPITKSPVFNDPGYRYKNPNDTRNANAPLGQTYCKFKTKCDLPSDSGVYALFVKQKLVYVGQTVNLHTRWSSSGYANISPKNVFYNGQSTNCKVNHYLLTKIGSCIELRYCVTKDYDMLEDELISFYKPTLNRKRG